MPTEAERSRERRWIILREDGRYVTLGRHSDPSEQEILAAEDGLRTQGLAGWLAVMEGNPYVGAVPRLMEVRRLSTPAVAFAEAEAVCIRAIVAQRSGLGG
jgi:hypothetical protein